MLDRGTIRLEHKQSKNHHPELKYDVNNLAPACDACNKLKGSRDASEMGYEAKPPANAASGYSEVPDLPESW